MYLLNAKNIGWVFTVQILCSFWAFKWIHMCEQTRLNVVKTGSWSSQTSGRMWEWVSIHKLKINSHKNSNCFHFFIYLATFFPLRSYFRIEYDRGLLWIAKGKSTMEYLMNKRNFCSKIQNTPVTTIDYLYKITYGILMFRLTAINKEHKKTN